MTRADFSCLGQNETEQWHEQFSLQTSVDPTVSLSWVGVPRVERVKLISDNRPDRRLLARIIGVSRSLP
jgi:hypothetical protein